MTGAAGFLLLAVAFVAANASFVSSRIFFIWRPGGRTPQRDKHGGWRVLEVVVLYLLTLALARALEARAGAIYPQTWEFYAVTACLFVVMGYPGFVFRYLLKRSNRGKGARA
ncbi:MAG: DUF2818 family protein [Betaproteobacteria bacterium]|nr:DUF2818 family protein [Betaproteobacteria bacterium]